MMKLLILALLFGTGAARVGDSRARGGTPDTLAAVAKAKDELDKAVGRRAAPHIAQGPCAKELNDLNQYNKPLIVYEKGPKKVIGHGSVAASNSPSNTQLQPKNILAPLKTTERPLAIQRAEEYATKWEKCCKDKKQEGGCHKFDEQKKVNVASVKLATAKAADINGDYAIIQADHAASKAGNTASQACLKKQVSCKPTLRNFMTAKAQGRSGAGLDATRDPWKSCCNCMKDQAKKDKKPGDFASLSGCEDMNTKGFMNANP